MTQEEFDILADVWNGDTCFLSRMDKIIDHPIYRAIIKVGKPMVTNIITRMEKYQDGSWFFALIKITGEKPKGFDEAETMEQGIQCWLDWWEENERNYL
jgi:hypothetical protein